MDCLFSRRSDIRAPGIRTGRAVRLRRDNKARAGAEGESEQPPPSWRGLCVRAGAGRRPAVAQLEVVVVDGGLTVEATNENVLFALLPRVVIAAMQTTTIRAS